MAKSVACPKCKSPIDLSTRDAEGRIVCTACGAKLKLNPPGQSQTQKPQGKSPQGSAPQSKTPTGQPNKQQPTAASNDQGLDDLGALEPASTGDDDWLNDDLSLESEAPLSMPAAAGNWGANPQGQADVDPLKPTPASPASGQRPGFTPKGASTPAPTKDEQKKKRDQMMIFGAIGGGVLLLLIIVVGLIVIIPMMEGSSDNQIVADGNDGGSGGGGSGTSGSGSDSSSGGNSMWSAQWVGGEIPVVPVTFEAPPEGSNAPEVNLESTAKLVTAEPFDESLHEPFGNPLVTRYAQVAEQNANMVVPTVEQLTYEDVAAWQAEADPASAESQFEFAADLDRELISAQSANLLVKAPIRGGPFFLLPPDWQREPYRNDYIELSGDRTYSPIEVLDLRTNEIVGTFDWKIPVRMQSALSPDGMRFLGPYHVPIQRPVPDDDIREAAGSLYVWTRDSDEPPVELDIQGYASWLGFVDSETAIILMELPTREIQLWDVSTGERRTQIELPPNFRNRIANVEEAGFHMQQFHFRNDVVVSPGGRYATVVTGATLTLVSLEEGSVLGETEAFLPVEQDQVIQGLSYSSDGTEIVVAYPASPGVHLVKLNALDGTRIVHQEFMINENPLVDRGWGPLFAGPRENSWIQAGRPRYQQAAYVAYYELGRPFSVLLPVEEFFLTSSTGEILTDSKRWPTDPNTRLTAKSPAEIDEMIRVAFDESATEPIDVDRSSLAAVSTDLPDVWRPITGTASVIQSDISVIPTMPWFARIRDDTIGAFLEVSTDKRPRSGHVVVDIWWNIDRATGLPTVEPIELRRWKRPEQNEPPFRTVAMSLDAERIVINDPLRKDRLDVWSSDGAWQYAFLPLGEGVFIEWTGFDADGHLLVLGGGEVTRLELGDQTVTAKYQTESTNYLLPAKLTQDRRKLVVSRGHSVDVLDVQSGQILNRMGVNADPADNPRLRMLYDFAFSPDGKKMAAAYANASYGSGLLRRIDVSNRGHKMVIAVWDLETGNAMMAGGLEMERMVELGWASPEHLLIGDDLAKVLDLKAGIITATYQRAQTRGGTYSHMHKMMAGDDYRLWRAYRDNHETAGLDPIWLELGGSLVSEERVPYWTVTALSDEIMEDERPLYAEDRQIMSIFDHPIRVTIDIGDESLAEVRARNVIYKLRERGFQIGGGGLELKIKASISDSWTRINDSANPTDGSPVPQVDYTWTLEDAEGRLLWTSRTSGEPDLERSRHVRQDFQGQGSPFDFQGMPMREAFAKEVLEKDFGRDDIIDFIPIAFMQSGDEYVQPPLELRQ